MAFECIYIECAECEIPVFQFRLDRIDFIGFLGGIIHRIHSSADRQAIVGLLRGRSASNQ